MGNDLALALALEGRTDAVEPEVRQLVVLAGALAKLPEPEIDLSFADALEARLLTDGLQQTPARPHLQVVRSVFPPTPAEEIVRRAPVVQLPRRRAVVRRSVAAVAAAAMISAFPISAVASSLPGSPGYGVKRMIERAEIRFFGTPAEDAFTRLGFANERVDEAAQLDAMGTDDRRLINETLEDSKREMLAAQELILGNTRDQRTLNRFADEMAAVQRRIESVAPAFPMSSQPAVQNLIDTTLQIQRAMANAMGATPATFPTGVALQSSTGSTSQKSSANWDGRSSSEASKGTTRRAVDETTENEPTGTGKDVSGVRDECAVIGEANGLGSITGSPTRAVCAAGSAAVDSSRPALDNADPVVEAARID